MKLFSVEIAISGTAYIKAETAEEAIKIAEKLEDSVLEIQTLSGSELFVDEREFNDPALPAISLSPAMTVCGVPDETVAEEMV